MRLCKLILSPVFLLAFISFIVGPYQARAEEPVLFPESTTSMTLLHPFPGIDYLTDYHGHSITLYEVMPGMQWVTTRDATGAITAQGSVFDPLPRLPPLTVPTGPNQNSPSRSDR